MTNPVNRFKYEGFAVGGPYKGASMMRVGDPVWRLESMKMVPFMPGHHLNTEGWIETGRRGQYEWDSGVWWWKGWE